MIFDFPQLDSDSFSTRSTLDVMSSPALWSFETQEGTVLTYQGSDRFEWVFFLS